MKYGWSEDKKTSGHEVVKPRTKMKRKKKNIPAKNIFGKGKMYESEKHQTATFLKRGDVT